MTADADFERRLGEAPQRSSNRPSAASRDTATTYRITSGIAPAIANSTGRCDLLRSLMPSAAASLAHPDSTHAAYGTNVAAPRRAARRRECPLLIGLTDARSPWRAIRPAVSRVRTIWG